MLAVNMENPQTVFKTTQIGDCLEEKVESFLDPPNEQELTDKFSDTSNPSSGLGNSESHLHQTLRPSQVRKPPDRYGEWLLNSVNSDKLLVELLRRVVTKLKPKLLWKARVGKESLNHLCVFQFSIELSPIISLRLFIVVVKFSLVRFLDMELLNCFKKKGGG